MRQQTPKTTPTTTPIRLVVFIVLDEVIEDCWVEATIIFVVSSRSSWDVVVIMLFIIKEESLWENLVVPKFKVPGKGTRWNVFSDKDAEPIPSCP